MSDAASVLVPLILWIVFAILVGEYARKRGRSATAWFLVAALLSPVIAFLAIAVMEPGTEGNSHRLCPFCAEKVKSAAIVCRYCGRDLPKDLLNELLN